MVDMTCCAVLRADVRWAWTACGAVWLPNAKPELKLRDRFIERERVMRFRAHEHGMRILNHNAYVPVRALCGPCTLPRGATHLAKYRSRTLRVTANRLSNVPRVRRNIFGRSARNDVSSGSSVSLTIKGAVLGGKSTGTALNCDGGFMEPLGAGSR